MSGAADSLSALYLDLMERVLTGMIFQDPPAAYNANDPSSKSFNAYLRTEGFDWPSLAHTMVGSLRIHNLRVLCEDVIRNGIPGDFIETGIWRGGSCILMRAVLKAHGDQQRTIWCADSFDGLPAPDPAYPQDASYTFHNYRTLAVSQETVMSNFEKYGLLDGQVKFLKGWFKDTLPTAPVERLAILRLDGDLYQSTMDALTSLYDKVSPRGYVIVDDYRTVKACEQATTDFRAERKIIDEIKVIDGSGVYWQKSS